VTFLLKDQLKKIQAKINPSVYNYFAMTNINHNPALEQALIEVRSLLGNITPREPNKEDLTTSYDTIVSLYNSDSHFNKLKKRIVRLSPWLIFTEIDRKRPPLYSIDDLSFVLIEHIKKLQDDKATLNLAFVFLRIYPKDLTLFDKINQIMTSLLPTLQKQRGKSFAQKAMTNNLFMPTGPKTVAKKLINNHRSVVDILDDSGLHGGCQEEGFIEEVYFEWIEEISIQLTKTTYDNYKKPLIRLLEYSIHNNTLRFARKRKKLIEGLLLPFQNKNPVEECKKHIRDFIIKYIGDPRFEPGYWTGINSAARKVLLTWLSEIVLADFFRLLDYSAKYDRDADRQWKYRKAFWSTCLNHRIIDNAWVVLGKKVAQSAHLFLDQKDHIYANISGSGVQGHHAVLILQIGNMIITEWSHSGKYRFWFESNPYAPKLYKDVYNRDDVIQHPEFEGAHHGAIRGSWQNSVADYIRKNIGYKLPFHEYMDI
jgi:hypothetical protein